jgi:hypothetical protein
VDNSCSLPWKLGDRSVYAPHLSSILSVGADAHGTSHFEKCEELGYDDHNRLTSYGSYRSYSYDAWNNLLSVSSSNGVGEAPN